MLQKVDFIWKNGKLINWDEAVDHNLTHTLHYGTGVFEGIRVYETKKGPAIFRLKEHIKRLFESAKIIGMNIPYSEEDLVNATINLIKENKLKSGYIRPLAYFGYGKMGLDVVNAKVDVIIAAWPWGTYLGEEGKTKGISVKISEYSRHNQKEGLNLVKATGFYINSMLAKMDALNNGYKEAILLDENKNIAEGSGENIFVIKNNKLYTPTTKHCLKGITRDTVIKIANDSGYEVIEKDITIDELMDCDGCFLTGTAAEVTSIVSVNNKLLGDGRVNKIAKEMQEKYDKIIIGEEEQYSNWLTIV